MDDKIIKLWMPVEKSFDGKFHAILSDTSIDRDEEMMSPELIKAWANSKALPATVNHENKMEKLVGGWENISYIQNGDNIALLAEPLFFPAEVSLEADELRKKIEYASSNGLNVGVSISAIPHDHITKKIGDKNYKVWTDAEIIEATWVPIQSNRNATYIGMAKSFNLHSEEKMDIKKEESVLQEINEENEKMPEAISKPKEVEDCVQALMDDPDFKPQEGRTKEESAWAVCQEKFKEKCPCQEKIKAKEVSNTEAFNKSLELVNKKVDELSKENEELKKELQSLRLAKKESDDKLNAIIKAPTQDAIKPDSFKKESELDVFLKGYYGEKK